MRRGEEIVRLTDREREMLRMLAATPGETVPRLALAGNGGSVSERAVDVQVNRLRRKIERDPANPLFVQTVRGIGYRLVITHMTSLDIGIRTIRTALERLGERGAGTTRCRRCAASTPCSAASPTAGGASAAGSTA